MLDHLLAFSIIVIGILGIFYTWYLILPLIRHCLSQRPSAAQVHEGFKTIKCWQDETGLIVDDEWSTVGKIFFWHCYVGGTCPNRLIKANWSDCSQPPRAERDHHWPKKKLGGYITLSNSSTQLIIHIHIGIRKMAAHYWLLLLDMLETGFAARWLARKGIKILCNLWKSIVGLMAAILRVKKKNQ